MTEKRRYRAEEEREQVKPKKRERYKPIKDYKGRCKHKKEREKDLSGPLPPSHDDTAKGKKDQSLSLSRMGSHAFVRTAS